ncbi:unnamed protein product [Candidula unifasciata]|uniref:Anoctamin n=1 Tax=Candidula unifasciata TaxID=100452 RepID=A0A8S3YUI7_9EUPU|nr:unnamed protein product [Candidula unifasciata]
MFMMERDDCFKENQLEGLLLGRRSLGAKRLVVSSKVLLPAIPTQNCDVVLTFPANTEDATLMWLLARLKSRAPALTVHVRHHSHTGIYGFYLTAVYENLLQGAEELGILKPLKSEYGGGMKEFVYEDQDCFAGVEDEASFLTSQERQSIVLHFLHELRATGDDSLEGISFIEGQPIVPLLKKHNLHIFTHFSAAANNKEGCISSLSLHNHEDLKHLHQTWVRAVFSPQPLDDVCRYFGVKIALYFAYLGHYTAWLILPALLGLGIFLLQEHSQWCEDLCYVGFAVFNTVWATLYLKFWKRSSTEFCYRWGTLEQKDDMLKDPRPLFNGDLVKSPITGQLELYYPAWKRLLFRYFITFPVIAVCLAFVFIVMLLCFELQEWVNELICIDELPYVFSFVPKVLLAIVVSIFDEIYKQIAIWLTHKENYRLQESHETSLVIKLVLFQFVNSFLSLFYIGFYLHDMDRLRDQLAALLITRQVVGNIKEALLPYVIWKARLYSVGLRIATRMSPASVEKEVRRMTARSSHGPKVVKDSKVSSKDMPAGNSGKNSDSEGSPVTEEDEERLPTLTQAEVESAMKTYEDTLDDYLEMCIQFGYITLFSSAFPLAALCALLNNIIEIRSDAFKLCHTFQRPFGQRVASIGIWQNVLLVMSVVAVIINCALVITSGLLERVWPGLSSIAYCLIVVSIEHLMITCKFALYCSIPDMPPAVATEIARLEYQRNEAIKQLVSQMTPNPSGGNTYLNFPGSPIVRRRKLENTLSELSMKESAPNNSTPSSGSEMPHFPTVITSSSAAMRPSDICLETRQAKPAVPPRCVLQKSEHVRPHLSSAHTDEADNVAATADSTLSSRDVKNPLPLPNSSATVATLTSLNMASWPGEVKEGDTMLRKGIQHRSDPEAWRRRSEPVASAVTEAVSLYRDKPVDPGLKKKSIYENKEDLRDSLKEEFKKSRDRLYLRQEIIRSRDRLNILGKRGDLHPQGKDEQIVRSSSTPRISATLAMLPPPAPNTSTAAAAAAAASATITAKYSASPRFIRGLIDSSKALSRKSRSLSSADVSDIRQAFKDRFSWRGEPSLARSGQKKLLVGLKKEAKQSVDSREGERSTILKTDKEIRQTGDVTEEDHEQILQQTDTSLSSVNNLNSGSSCLKDVDLSQSESQPDASTNLIKSANELKTSSVYRAVRESASKPLLLPQNLDLKKTT